ncbi:hypothetical protein HA402_001643 [Bradysia odoriphaga]|nr:hypothetical protein HA402_001643 [Bradysia odoriphaga]
MVSVAHLFFVSLAVMLTDGSVSIHNPFYCFSQDPFRPQIGMFATTTAYETVRGQAINPNVSNCTPSKFWLVSRHGTRLPAVGNLVNILENYERLHRAVLSNYENGRTSLCAADIALIRNWTFDTNITLEVSQHLTTSGWNELEGLARRYQSAFPSVLSSTYSLQDYLFRFANTQRSEFSLRAFADGLFGANKSDLVQFEDVPAVDTFLLPQTSCPLWNNVTSAQIEHLQFREGPEYEQMLSQVSAKLGFHGSHALKANEVEMFATICEYDQVFNLSAPSPLCGAFSVANYQILEYYQDLDFYYRSGYGFSNYRRLFENLPCFLMQDLLSFIQSNDVDDHKAKIYNTNGTPLMIMLVTFGAFQDNVPLTRHNFAQQNQRLWKTSLISPMATNLAVMRYDCADGDNDVLFLYNEKPLIIPGCQPNGLCKQSFLLEKFSRFLRANCEEMFCSNS